MDENMQLCRICISNSECSTMIPIFGEDLLYKKITMLADVKMEKGDTLPQQVCIECAKSAISACMFKKKCEDADNFFRHHLQMMRKMEHHHRGVGGDVITVSEGSDNDPIDEMNLAGRNLISGANPMLMNGNNSSSSGALDNSDLKSYDLSSVRSMMNNYLMEQQAKEADAMAAFNGYQGGFAPPCDASMDDDHLPLIPEIELITPQDEGTIDRQNGNVQGHGYQCNVCYQLFTRKLILKEHMQSCHGRSPPVYECTNCKKAYLYKRFLEKHVRRGRCVKKRRNQTRPMECTDCHVLFPTGHHLGWHKRTGCPSRAAKVPLQQLMKQNIVQYNNFPKPVIPPRKPDNAFYMQNKKNFPNNNSKRKGRTRIKLDEHKIALAKYLILKEATTTQIAQELDISRTFAWRLRKNLVNGVSLHERFIDPAGENLFQKPETEQQAIAMIPEISNGPIEQMDLSIKPEQIQNNNLKAAENNVEIKQELQEVAEEEDSSEDDDDDDNEDNEDEEEDSSDDDDDDDSSDDDDDDDDDEDEDEQDTNKSANDKITSNCDEQSRNYEQNYQSGYANGGSKHMEQQIEQTNVCGIPQSTSAMEIPSTNPMNMHNENAESDSDSDEDGNDDNDDDDDEDDDETEDSDEEEEGPDDVKSNDEQMQIYKQHLMQNLPSVFQIPQPGFPQPVNLSIRSDQHQSSNLTPTTKKPRKPNVFIDDEKYATAKILVSQNSSTMEIARQLNVSQMTAWKLRDAIVKGIPLSYRSKRETRPKAPEKPPKPVASSTPKDKMPRQRLKAADRELRDREITREILEMIKEDSNIQYWKISARLADKGYAISPSSVCQKLKALGIHRRWKPGDKPPILDMDNVKESGGGNSGVGSVGGLGGGTSTDSFEFNNEQQFELGGAHFLSAFTH